MAFAGHSNDLRWVLDYHTGKKTGVLSHLDIKCIMLPRQARDKHRENSKKARFVAENASSYYRPEWSFWQAGIGTAAKYNATTFSPRVGDWTNVQVRKTVFFRHLYIKVMILPRQARDKHRENSKRHRFLAGRDCARDPL